MWQDTFVHISALFTYLPTTCSSFFRLQGFPLGARMTSYGRNDREPTPLDDNGRPIRLPRGAARDQQRRRQEGPEDGAEGGEWETVPRSPESERRLARAGGLADSASDWRKGSGATGPNKRSNDSIPGRGGLRGNRNEMDGKRGTGGSSAFPSWMADPNETPSWMEDSPTTSSNISLPNTSEKKERGRLNFDAFKGMDAHVTPLEGEDSIQAFKREMKRREAEARAKETTEDVDRRDAVDKPQTNKLGPPPGLSRSQDGPFHESSQAALSNASGSKPPGLSHVVQSSDTANEPTATSAKPEGASGDFEERSASNQTPSTAASGAGGRGSSRFARFFDPAAANNKAKEAQEKAMATRAPAGGMSEGQGGSSGIDPQSRSGNADGMATLFANMGLKPQNQVQQESNPAGGTSSPQPTSADVQGMQKIMAMLRGGGGGPDGAHGSKSPSAGSAGQTDTVGGSSANLMAMLAGASTIHGRSDTPSSPQQRSQSGQNQSQRHSLQSGPPPGFDLSRLAAGGGRESPTHAQMQHGGAGFSASSGMPNRSQSPGVPFRNDHGPPQQYGSQAPGPYGQGPPPGFGGRPGSGFGLDPRMMGRPSPGGGSLHGADSSPAGTPGGGAGTRDPNGHGGDNGGGPSLANLPPHIQQQLMGLPPHVQHAILSGHARGPMPSGPPPFHPSMQGLPPPPGISGPPQGPPHHLGPFGPPPSNHSHHYGLPPFLAGHQGPYGGGNGGSSPGGMPPHHLGPYSPSAGHSGMSPHPPAASAHGPPPPPGAGGSGGGFPPGLMHGPPPGIYGGQGR